MATTNETVENEVIDRLVHLNRVAKVVKGGRRFSFSALVVAGDQNGRVGAGLGKPTNSKHRKGVEQAKKNMFEVPLNGTVPHEVTGHAGAGRVLRPASGHWCYRWWCGSSSSSLWRSQYSDQVHW